MTELSHERRGSGPPLVLIHGLGSHRQVWTPIVATLARHRDVIALDLPGFGELAGRDKVWIRDTSYDDEVYFEELGPDGRRLRQVTVEADGTMVRSGPDDWPFNPPRDLYNPDLLRYEISADEFEQAWNAA